MKKEKNLKKNSKMDPKKDSKKKRGAGHPCMAGRGEADGKMYVVFAMSQEAGREKLRGANIKSMAL